MNEYTQKVWGDTCFSLPLLSPLFREVDDFQLRCIANIPSSPADISDTSAAKCNKEGKRPDPQCVHTGYYCSTNGSALAYQEKGV